MAVIKSFELEGNKQSFASWISNLSPCDTPFTSMIGKEGITQAQYSWQTDTLAPADNNPYEEGSQFVAQTRPTTREITNFTSILRATASVSSTAEAVATHGRGSELAYQMTKAGKELMRDLEWMNLSSVNGHPGTDTKASRFAGFEGLVAGLYAHDNDTGAVVHKEIEVSSKRHTCMEADDIFDMTYNLYLAGSKADKIMFHPKHALAFSSMIGNDPNRLLTYRMFDGLDTKFNTQVKKLRDPLGRTYTLIPNRYVPEDKIYFFNEADWTQMILRAPKRVRLAKNGASETHMIEMEVGLRHRHPFASGVLAIKDVNVQNTLPLTKLEFTTNIGEVHPVTGLTTIDGVGEVGSKVHFYSSDSDIVFFEHNMVETTANGMSSNNLIAGNKKGTAQIWTVCRGVRSEVHTVVCADPMIELTSDNLYPTVGTSFNITAVVTNVDLDPVGVGVPVKWFVSSKDSVELTEGETVTDINGTATVEAVVRNTDEIIVQAYINRVVSNNVVLNYKPKAAVIEDPAITPDTFGVNDTVNVAVDIEDDFGHALVGATVNWSVHPQGVATLGSTESRTNDVGTAFTTLTGIARGAGYLTASADGMTSTPIPFFVATSANMDFTISPNPVPVGETTKLTVKLTGHDGSPLRDTEILMTASPSITGLQGGTTDNFGVFEGDLTPLVEGAFEITATSTSFGASQSVRLLAEDNGHNIYYDHVISGHTGLHTHSTGIPKVVKIVTSKFTEPSPGLRFDCFSLNPEIAEAFVVDVPSNHLGESHIEVYGRGVGTARFRARVRGNASNFIDFEIRVGAPSLEVFVTPTTQTAGKDVEFSASFKDANDDWIPGAEIEWVYPPLMLANATTLPTVQTDQYGRVYHVRKAGAWGTHTFHARVANNPAIRSRDHKLTSVL